jgi:2-polyprenyl-6-methoxyphenol hydroxylase-like FAD-dependent oxidoreductase
MSVSNRPIIIGAGPTGLAAALFLLERGITPTIIERRDSRSPHSKAFGVSARTMELLSTSGVTQRFIENGWRLERLNLNRSGSVLGTIRLDKVKTDYPFMLVQGQEASEKILEEELNRRGLFVQRGLEVIDTKISGGEGVIQLTSGEVTKDLIGKHILVADGASSATRQRLGISFEGNSYPEPWSLIDLELDTELPMNEATIFMLDQGGMFVIRHTENIWRVLGNAPDMLSHLHASTKTGKVVWESSFEIANKVASKFQVGPYFLAGDAAHVHAGIGARGMNLGIEDAYVWAELLRRGQLDNYEKVRRPAIKKVISQIKRAMNVPRPQTIPGKMVRRFPGVVKKVLPHAGDKAGSWILGLDHPLGI